MPEQIPHVPYLQLYQNVHKEILKVYFWNEYDSKSTYLHRKPLWNKLGLVYIIYAQHA